MTTVAINLIAIDDKGVARIAGSRSRVTNIVLDTRNGLTPERICDENSHLSMAQVHAALSYYYAHKAELDAEIDREHREYLEAREQAGESPIAVRVRAAGKIL